MVEKEASDLSLEIAGPRAWHTIEHAYQQADRIAQEAVGNIPCRSCSGEEGLELVRGIHDVKNVELGKPVFDPQGFRRFHARVDAAADRAGLDHSGIGRQIINTRFSRSRPEPKMDMKDELGVYGGAIVEKVIDVGVKTTDATPITPTIRNSTIYNIVAAIVGGGVAYYWRNRGARGVTAAAFSAAAVNNLIEDAAKAAGLPGATGVGAVRRIAPFIPATGPSISPSQAAAQSGAPALF